ARRGESFRKLGQYLLRGGESRDSDRVAWTSSRHLPTPFAPQAVDFMESTSQQFKDVDKPVYHLSLSLAPGEHLTPEQWQPVIDKVLGDLGLQNHQALVVAHRDRGHEHVHVMVNRVNVATGELWFGRFDYATIERSLRSIERELGFREVPGHHGRLPGQEPPDRSQGLTSGERRHQDKTGEVPWIETLRAELAGDFREATSWTDLAARLRERGLELQAKGRGLVVTDGEREAKASRIARDASRGHLEERFGPFQEWRRELAELGKEVDAFRLAEAQRLAQGENWQRTVKLAEKAEARVAGYDKLLADRERLEGELRSRLTRAYGKDGAEQIFQEVRTRGGERRSLGADPELETYRRLTQEPERFGRLAGAEIAGFETPARRQAREDARAAGQAYRQLLATESAEMHARGPARSARKRSPRLRAHAVKLAHREPVNDDALRSIGRIALRLGEHQAGALLGHEVAAAGRLLRAGLEGHLAAALRGKAKAYLLGPAALPVEILTRAVRLFRDSRGFERD
ncbi:MAG: relaxase/mobilization nuclease domain-containing protein, partial [Thermoanaerobaculia bacterium]|nr:relaxase/mobilization nuclease domain-containing protein [Thermoanaerobaculia bacterium]